MKKLVWDTSAILNLKDERDSYSPALRLFEDLEVGNIIGPYRNYYPALSVFEVNAAVSRKHREGNKLLREFYILHEHSEIFPIDQTFVRASAPIVVLPGFNELKGADLVFACIAKVLDAYLITLDNHFEKVRGQIKVVNLLHSMDAPNYRKDFGVSSEQRMIERAQGLPKHLPRGGE